MCQPKRASFPALTKVQTSAIAMPWGEQHKETKNRGIATDILGDERLFDGFLDGGRATPTIQSKSYHVPQGRPSNICSLWEPLGDSQCCSRVIACLGP